MSTATLEFLRKKAAALAEEIKTAKDKRQPYGHLQRQRIRVVAQAVRADVGEQRRREAQRPKADLLQLPFEVHP